jgi:hypothetical protein
VRDEIERRAAGARAGDQHEPHDQHHQN